MQLQFQGIQVIEHTVNGESSRLKIKVTDDTAGQDARDLTGLDVFYREPEDGEILLATGGFGLNVLEKTTGQKPQNKRLSQPAFEAIVRLIQKLPVETVSTDSKYNLLVSVLRSAAIFQFPLTPNWFPQK